MFRWNGHGPHPRPFRLFNQEMDKPNSLQNRTENFKPKPKRNKSDRRWTLLFISDHGRVITLKRFKTLVFIGLFMVVLAAAGAVFFYWQGQNIIQKNEKLQTSLDVLEKQIKVLKHEKDILTARLVLSESRVKESLEAPKPDQAENSANDMEVKKIDADFSAGKSGARQNIAVAQTADKAEDGPEASPPNLSVEVEEFGITLQPSSQSLQVQFKVKNTTPNSQRVSGHVIVILEDAAVAPKQWIAIPPMELVDGKPTGKQRGHRFAINHFRTMRLTANIPDSPDRFQTAAVYVFAGNGELLLEKDFPISLTAQPG
jgi:cell division protein FtsL